MSYLDNSQLNSKLFSEGMDAKERSHKVPYDEMNTVIVRNTKGRKFKKFKKGFRKKKDNE